MAAEVSSQSKLAPISSRLGSRTRQDLSIPDLYTTLPAIRDTLDTPTSVLQDQTVRDVLPFLTGELHVEDLNAHGIPFLDKARHVKYLQKMLGQLPGKFMGADPSRPWIFYWTLAGMSILGEDVGTYRDQLISTLRPMQNGEGGFAGGFGQTSHLATTYASILALTLVGGTDAYEIIDRKAMWKWLCSLKQPDGGFQMAVGGEEDVRGAYCAAVIISLLNIPQDLSPDSPACNAGHRMLFDGLAEWVGRSQTYEGGIAACPGLEAHGAYAFCALGCLSIIDSPHRSVPRHLNVENLMLWLSSRQYAPEGGFSGRTNKLVDGCYSHWVGGCWPLLEATLEGPEGSAASSATLSDSSLYDRNGLIRYILCCCQDTRGGMRDKPSKFSDAYHTCYVLSGLSSAQHKWTLAQARPEGSIAYGDRWTVKVHAPVEHLYLAGDRIEATHPVYVVPIDKVVAVQEHFGGKAGF